MPNGTGAVAVDSPQIDVITTPQPSGTCPTVASSTLAGYDLAAGTFTPQQLLVSFDSSRAWIITSQSSVLTFDLTTNTPTSIPLAGGTVALSGELRRATWRLNVETSVGSVSLNEKSSLSDAQQK